MLHIGIGTESQAPPGDRSKTFADEFGPVIRSIAYLPQGPLP